MKYFIRRSPFQRAFPLPSPKVCGNHWLLKQPPVVISAMLVVTGGLPFPGNLLWRQFQVMETLISSAWSKVGLVLGRTGGSQVSPGLRQPRRGRGGDCSPRGDFRGRGATRSGCLHSPRTHTHTHTQRHANAEAQTVSRRAFKSPNTKREGFIGV